MAYISSKFVYGYVCLNNELVLLNSLLFIIIDVRCSRNDSILEPVLLLDMKLLVPLCILPWLTMEPSRLYADLLVGELISI